MIGLDTNILVRYLTQDDPAQARLVNRVIDKAAEAGDTFFITAVALCELVWVLEDVYRYKKAEILQALESILRTAQFRFESKKELWRAFHDYQSGKADFSDYVIGQIGLASGCNTTLTFDGGLKGASSFELL